MYSGLTIFTITTIVLTILALSSAQVGFGGYLGLIGVDIACFAVIVGAAVRAQMKRAKEREQELQVTSSDLTQTPAASPGPLLITPVAAPVVPATPLESFQIPLVISAGLESHNISLLEWKPHFEEFLEHVGSFLKAWANAYFRSKKLTAENVDTNINGLINQIKEIITGLCNNPRQLSRIAVSTIVVKNIEVTRLQAALVEKNFLSQLPLLLTPSDFQDPSIEIVRGILKTISQSPIDPKTLAAFIKEIKDTLRLFLQTKQKNDEEAQTKAEKKYQLALSKLVDHLFQSTSWPNGQFEQWAADFLPCALVTLRRTLLEEKLLSEITKLPKEFKEEGKFNSTAERGKIRAAASSWGGEFAMMRGEVNPNIDPIPFLEDSLKEKLKETAKLFRTALINPLYSGLYEQGHPLRKWLEEYAKKDFLENFSVKTHAKMEWPDYFAQYNAAFDKVTQAFNNAFTS